MSSLCRCMYRGPKRVQVCASCIPRVIIESPFAGDIKRNVAYAQAALSDSLRRGEAPLASHLIYPQVLDDATKEERLQGIEAGLAWALSADLVGVYWNRGISPGMVLGIKRHLENGVQVEYRSIPAYAHEYGRGDLWACPNVKGEWSIGAKGLCLGCSFPAILPIV